MESETSKCYNKLETNKQQQRSSSLNRSNDVYFRQKIDNIKSQTSSIRNDTNTYFEKLVFKISYMRTQKKKGLSEFQTHF